MGVSSRLLRRLGLAPAERAPADGSARRAAQELEAVIEASPLAVFAYDRRGIVTLWNIAAERMFGWSTDEAIGQPLPIVPAELDQELRTIRKRVLGGQPSIGFETVRRRKDGSPIEVRWSNAPVRGLGGAVEGVVAFVEDVSERGRAERNLETERALLLEREQAARQGAEAATELLELVADRAAIAIERARLYDREHRVAELLQRSMLPRHLPSLAGVELRARYIPGSKGLVVGGDWYDVLELPDGRLGVAIGDVVGKGLPAASEMGQVRNAFRAYALEGYEPNGVLARLDRLVEREGAGEYSTLLYVMLDLETSVATFARAGHPPPLLVRCDRTTAFLEDGGSLPLGLGSAARRASEGSVWLEPGSTLVLYTDGLVERRDRSIEAGLALLERAASTAPAWSQLLDWVVGEAEREGEADDDVAVVTLRLPEA